MSQEKTPPPFPPRKRDNHSGVSSRKDNDPAHVDEGTQPRKGKKGRVEEVIDDETGGTRPTRGRERSADKSDQRNGSRERDRSPAAKASDTADRNHARSDSPAGSPKKGFGSKLKGMFGGHNGDKQPESDDGSEEDEDEDVKIPQKTEGQKGSKTARRRDVDERPAPPEYAEDDKHKHRKDKEGNRNVPRTRRDSGTGVAPDLAGGSKRHPARDGPARPRKEDVRYGRDATTPRKSDEGHGGGGHLCGTCGQPVPDCEECGQTLPPELVRARVRSSRR